jgi:uncharacterized paraquat-inducible protein A
MDQSDFVIVTLCCEGCSRAFRTLAWIAEEKKPTCPRCHVRMVVRDRGGLEQLSKPLRRRRKAA